MSIFDKLVVWTIPFVPKPIVRRVSSRYIAGETLDDAVRVVRGLNEQGCCATLDLLGEFIRKPQEADLALNYYLKALERIHSEGLDANISIKLTMFGLLLDLEHCYQTVLKLVQRAHELDNFIRIDMEDSPCTDSTLEIYSRLRQEYDNVGFVMQAYMRRSLADINEMMARHKRIDVRVCKGIYIEPREIAYKDMAIINANFDLLVEELLKNGNYVGIATHDEKLVWRAYRTIHTLNLSKNEFEFQMLLGVDDQLRRLIVKDGHRLRVYVPFGRRWYQYAMRRLKENPAIARHVVKNLFRLS